jgi:hypothetical protein
LEEAMGEGRGGREDPAARAGTAAAPSAVDEILDRVVPRQVEWRGCVTSYPKSALALAALGGFALGRARGREMLSALSVFAAEAVTEGINDFLGRDVV